VFRSIIAVPGLPGAGHRLSSTKSSVSVPVRMHPSAIIAILAIAIVFSVLGLSNPAGSQEAAAAVRPDIDGITADVYYLASDELEGRLAGSPGAELAAEYIAERFSSLGLVPADTIDGDYNQEFEITTAVSLGDGNRLAITTSAGALEPCVEQGYIPLCMSADGTVEGEVVFAGYGITAPEYGWDDYEKVDAGGRIVFCLRSEPRQDDPESIFNGVYPTQYAGIRWKAQNAADHGAIGLILATGPINIPEGQEDKLISLGEGIGFGESTIPVIQIDQATAEFLWSGMGAPLGMFQGEMNRHMMAVGMPIEGVTVLLTVNLEKELATTWNVAGILPGSDEILKDEYVIIGAHYDHIGWGDFASKYQGEERQIHNGADDNASGTAGVLELARMFASQPRSPARSILFICFTAEEIGGLGSIAYMSSPLVPLERTSAMINMDMIGRVSAGEDGSLFCTIQGLGSAKEWSEIVPDVTPDGLVSLILSPDPIGGSDYIQFMPGGVPVLNFFSGLHDDYHQPTDDADRINYAGMVSIVEAVYEIASEVSGYAHMLTRAQPEEPVPASGDADSGITYEVYLGTVPDFARTEGGFWIAGVREGSPAEEGGLMPGDQILKLGGYDVSDIYNYTWALGQFKPGDTVEIVVMRDGEELTLTVTFAARE